MQNKLMQSHPAAAMMSRFRPHHLALMLFLLVSNGCTQSANNPPTPPSVQYKSFNNETLPLFAWKGQKVAFLTESKELDPKIMARLCDTFDKVYAYYQEATGCEPAKAMQYEGLVSIAEVKNTCGAGCGYLGSTGIELMPDCFRTLYDGVSKQDVYDQALPYEFGRNFWFYSPQLAYKKDADAGSVVTGYAVFMRFLALDSAGVTLGSFRDRSGGEFRAELEKLVDLYVSDPSLRWENTLKIGAGPKNPLGLNGTDLFASFCFRLCQENGGPKYAERLWQEAGKRPMAKTTPEAVDNFVIAASMAAGKDLTELFEKTWRWPVSEAARHEVAQNLKDPKAK
jgi:hypothetical protein